MLIEMDAMKRCYQFSPDQTAAIDRLADELGLTKTNVLRSGLLLMRMAVRAVRDGKRLAVIDNDGSSERLVGVWDEAEPTRAA